MADKTEVVPAPAPGEPWKMSAAAAATPWNLPKAKALSAVILQSAPVTPTKRGVKQEDDEAPAPAAPTIPTMLPEAPANTDESHQEDREQLYVFTEQKRGHYAVPQRDAPHLRDAMGAKSFR